MERRQVHVGKIGWEIDRAEPRGCRTKGDPGTRGNCDDALRIVGVGDHRTAESDLPTTAYGLAGDTDGADVVCRVENVQRVRHRGGDNFAVPPSAGFGSGNGEWGGHESAAAVAHVGTEAHGVGIELLVETSAEIPIGDQPFGTHQVSEALPVLVGWTLSDVSD